MFDLVPVGEGEELYSYEPLSRELLGPGLPDLEELGGYGSATLGGTLYNAHLSLYNAHLTLYNALLLCLQVSGTCEGGGGA